MRTRPTQSADMQESHAPRSAQLPAAARAASDGAGLVPALIGLQRAYGNRFVQRLLSDTARGNFEAPANVNETIHRTRGDGHALPPSVQRSMESAFGADFSSVRLHTDSTADTLSRSLEAVAFTTGSDVYFRQGAYDPEGATGRRLLAHELTHVVQQSGSTPQGNLVVGPADDAYEQEAERAADAVVHSVSHEPRHASAAAGQAQGDSIQRMCATCAKEEEEKQPHIQRCAECDEEKRRAGLSNMPSSQVGRMIQRTPAPGSNFGTRRYCGFGITTYIPGFIKDLFTGTFDVDYTTGCAWVAGNAWDSIWELYDASDRLIDSNEEAPYGDYEIEDSFINRGTPGDGSANWSLWYRITESNPWVRDDDDAYPYDYKEFPVYSAPIRNPAVQLREELGDVVWEDRFTPAEDGASLQYNFTATASRQTSDSQTTSVSGTVGGDKSANLSCSYDGLTGGFSNRLSYSATASISRTRSVSVATSQTTSKTFSQPGLRGGVTYRIVARPIYHLLDGSVDLIPHRNGVITGSSSPITGAIRVLKGLDVTMDTVSRGSGSRSGSGSGSGGDVGTLARKWGCEDVRCNVYPVREGAQCPERVIGNSAYIYPSFDDACEAAKRDANTQVPEGCNKRHCNCNTKCSQK